MFNLARAAASKRPARQRINVALYPYRNLDDRRTYACLVTPLLNFPKAMLPVYMVLILVPVYMVLILGFLSAPDFAQTGQVSTCER